MFFTELNRCTGFWHTISYRVLVDVDVSATIGRTAFQISQKNSLPDILHQRITFTVMFSCYTQCIWWNFNVKNDLFTSLLTRKVHGDVSVVFSVNWGIWCHIRLWRHWCPTEKHNKQGQRKEQFTFVNISWVIFSVCIKCSLWKSTQSCEVFFKKKLIN